MLVFKQVFTFLKRAVILLVCDHSIYCMSVAEQCIIGFLKALDTNNNPTTFQINTLCLQ